MKRRPKKDDLVFSACLVAFVIFCGLGLAGALPGQCPADSDKLVCLHYKGGEGR